MTLEEVLEAAATMEGDERWKQWIACGQHGHVLETLPKTSSGIDAPSYCPKCFCVFGGPAGRLWNPPVPPL